MPDIFDFHQNVVDNFVLFYRVFAAIIKSRHVSSFIGAEFFSSVPFAPGNRLAFTSSIV